MAGRAARAGGDAARDAARARHRRPQDRRPRRAGVQQLVPWRQARQRRRAHQRGDAPARLGGDGRRRGRARAGRGGAGRRPSGLLAGGGGAAGRRTTHHDCARRGHRRAGAGAGRGHGHRHRAADLGRLVGSRSRPSSAKSTWRSTTPSARSCSPNRSTWTSCSGSRAGAAACAAAQSVAAPAGVAEVAAAEGAGVACAVDDGEGDYLNCPLTRADYDAFYEALVTAESATIHDFDQATFFEGCLPIEVMAHRGRDTLRFGPMKPVGLEDPRTGRRPYRRGAAPPGHAGRRSLQPGGLPDPAQVGRTEPRPQADSGAGAGRVRPLRDGPPQHLHQRPQGPAPDLADQGPRRPVLRRADLRRRRLRRVGGVGADRRHQRGARRRRGSRRSSPRAPPPSVRSPITPRTPIRATTSRRTSPSASCRRSTSRRATRRRARRCWPSGRCATWRRGRDERRGQGLSRAPDATTATCRPTRCGPTPATSSSTWPAWPRAGARGSRRSPPADLDPASVRAFVVELNRSDHARASVARKLSGVRAFLRYLRREGLVASDPAAAVVAPRLDRTIPRHLSEAEMRRLLDTPDPSTPLGRRDRAILELFYASGLRLSELVGLDLEDVHLSARMLRVLGKGGKERLLPFNRAAETALKDWLPDRERYRRSAAEAEAAPAARGSGSPRSRLGEARATGRGRASRPGREPVFVNARGGRLTGRSVHRLVRRYVAAVQPAGRDQPARAAPLVRHAPAAARRRLAGHPGTARPRPADHHRAIHAREQRPARGRVPEGASPSPTRTGIRDRDRGSGLDSDEITRASVTVRPGLAQSLAPSPGPAYATSLACTIRRRGSSMLSVLIL